MEIIDLENNFMKKENDDIIMYYHGKNNDLPKNYFVDKKSNEIIAASYEHIEVSEDEIDLCDCKEFVEGTCVMIFFFKSWRVCTSSFLDASECFWKSEKSVFELTKECVDNWELFLESLDKTKLYCYTLIHHENKHLIDYTYKFGNDYKLLDLFFVRTMYTLESNIVSSLVHA